jgi:hypothetical protein
MISEERSSFNGLIVRFWVLLKKILKTVAKDEKSCLSLQRENQGRLIGSI